MTWRAASIAMLFLSSLGTLTAEAHKPSDSYLRIDSAAGTFQAEWDIALKDLELLVGLDADQNGQITWGEVKRQRSAIEAHALNHLQVAGEGGECDLEVTDLKITSHSDGAYVVLLLEGELPSNAAELTLTYSLLFDVDPTHRGLVLLRGEGIASTHVLRPDGATLPLSGGEHTLWQAFVDYTGEGVWHIWIGFDHILFLISLLLPAVLVRQENRWQGVESFAPALKEVLKIVTVFTLAHSITLWLAVMEYVVLPSKFVEATIAFSIIVTAMSNLWPVLPLSGARIAFVFGLVHGFGFANVLLDLGLSSASMAVTLFGFNVGVELGQIAIVAAFLPIAYLMRNSAFYLYVILRGGSVLIASLAAIWFYERVANVEILGF